MNEQAAASGAGSGGAGRRGSGTTTDTICGKCNKKTLKKEKAVRCELCSQWYHATCVEIGDALYEAITNDSNKALATIHFYCPKPCNNLASKFLLNLAKLENKVDNLQEEVETLHEKMNKMEGGDLPQGMRDAVKQIAETQSEKKDENETLMYEIADKASKKEMAEFRDRTRRATNLLVFKLKEDTSNGKEHGLKTDEEAVQKILREIKGKHQPTEIRRLGKLFSNTERGEAKPEGRDAGKTRPLRLTFASESARDDTMRAYHKARKEAQEQLEGDDPGIICKIALRKDLTPKERQEEDDLYQDLKQKREASKNSGDTRAHWIRRDGQVVNVGKYPDRATGQSPVTSH